MRKIFEHSTGKYLAKVYRDSVNDEYRVILSYEGKRCHPDADYFTSDKEDALGTAKAMTADAIVSDLRKLETPELVWDKDAKEHIEQPRNPIVYRPQHDDYPAIAIVSAEDGGYFADYYGEYRGNDAWIHPDLESFAKNHGLMWEWINPGCIGLFHW
jgi:hypothetical protein